MTSTWRLVAVLAGICAVAGLSLAGVYEVTKEPIAYQKKLEMIKSLEEVLPGLETDPDSYYLDMKREDGAPVRVFRSRGEGGGTVAGAAFQVVAPDGYSGNIYIMMGVMPDEKLGGIAILSHAETPGLGSPIAEEPWKGTFKGRSLDDTDFRVKKDGGEIDQLTGATISPRAITGAVKKGLIWFRDNKDDILDASKGVSTADTTSGDAS